MDLVAEFGCVLRVFLTVFAKTHVGSLDEGLDLTYDATRRFSGAQTTCCVMAGVFS